jgi:glycosyltransferase involved in cell wall biosynthesis
MSVVSIVIPTYNRAADLRRALGSVVAQTLSDWEAWIVDNHSTDETRQVVEQFADPRIHFLSVHNQGVVAVSRNLGVAHSTSRYVAFLDSDDWWKPQKLEHSVAALEHGADVVYHDLYFAHTNEMRWHLRRAATRQLRAPVRQDLLEHGNAITNSSVVLRRQIFLAAGGLSEDRNIASWEDYDCWLRIGRVTDGFIRIPRTLGYYWVGGGNLSSPQRTLRNLAEVLRLHLDPTGTHATCELPAWFQYALGLSHYQLGEHLMATKHLRGALRKGLPPHRRARALFFTAAAGARMALVRRRRSG